VSRTAPVAEFEKLDSETAHVENLPLVEVLSELLRRKYIHIDGFCDYLLHTEHKQVHCNPNKNIPLHALDGQSNAENFG
jgi:hypothetical protein